MSRNKTKRTQVTVKDGRELIGDFQCMDNYGNIILANTVEEAVIERRFELLGRHCSTSTMT